MWHASVAPYGKNRVSILYLRNVALIHLAGVGDRLHEWEEYTGYGFHLRRRLTAEEESAVGPVVDCRGTLEWRRRFDAIATELPRAAIALAEEEMHR